MLIQCESCRTIFRLDEARLKKGGSKVRCSRCGSLFTAYPPVAPSKDKETAPMAVPKPQEEERPSDLIAMGVEEEPETRPMGKDEAFEAELESVYKTALAESPPEPEKEEIVSFPEKRDWEEEEEEEPEEEKGLLERDIEPAEPLPPPKKPARTGIRTVLLTILLILLTGIAGVAYLKPIWIEPYLTLLPPPEKQPPPDPGVRLLQFESVAGAFVDAARGGQLFVIRGMVRSKYPQPRSHILVKGSILDNAGKTVESRVSYAGNAFTEDELRTLPMEEILKAMQNRDGMARQNVNVRPEAAIPFMIVFQNLSDNMSEFTVEAVSSSPGS